MKPYTPHLTQPINGEVNTGDKQGILNILMHRNSLLSTGATYFTLSKNSDFEDLLSHFCDLYLEYRLNVGEHKADQDKAREKVYAAGNAFLQLAGNDDRQRAIKVLNNLLGRADELIAELMPEAALTTPEPEHPSTSQTQDKSGHPPLLLNSIEPEMESAISKSLNSLPCIEDAYNISHMLGKDMSENLASAERYALAYFNFLTGNFPKRQSDEALSELDTYADAMLESFTPANHTIAGAQHSQAKKPVLSSQDDAQDYLEDLRGAIITIIHENPGFIQKDSLFSVHDIETIGTSYSQTPLSHYALTLSGHERESGILFKTPGSRRR